MSSDEIPSNEDVDDASPLSSTPITTIEYSRMVAQYLRHLDDALIHAIDELTIFNNETMSDLSLKYAEVCNNGKLIDYILSKKAVSAIPAGLKCETQYSCYG